jgi:Spy/CpxP family protein refolding chaperone
MNGKMMAAGGLVAMAVGLAGAWWIVHTPSSPYASLQAREISTLSEKEMADLREGRGMGYALAAELNGYPGPRHVLELAARLELTAEQQQKTQALFDSMKRETSALGVRLIEAERGLHALFASKQASAEEISTLTSRASGIEGELRAAHLKYHLAMLELMNPQQVEAYKNMRGYGGGHQMNH